MSGNWPLALTLYAFLALSIVYVVYTWKRRRRFTRERFAFAAMSSIVALTVIVFSILSEGPSHWDIAAAIIGISFDVKFSPPKPGWVEYSIMGMVYWICVNTLSTFYHRWDGQCSERQHNMEQRRETMPLIKEGGEELLRFLLRRPALSVFSPEPHKLISQLQPSSDSVTWRDRARSLVQLRYPYFSFPDSTAWHDEAHCWVGRNRNTGDFVLMRCSQSDLDELGISLFVNYSRRLTSTPDQHTVKLILAIQDDTPRSRVEHDSVEIEIVTESSLLDQLVDWSEYKRDINRRMSVISLPDSELTIADVFVQPHFNNPQKGSGYDEPLKEHIDQWLLEAGQRQLALLGDYGQGKSTAALALCSEYLTAKEPHRVPILIELRGTSPRNLTPLELFGAWASKYSIDPRSLYQLHIAGRLLIIFEGFDEMALIGDSEMRLNHFKTLWEFCVPDAKIMITGRPNFFFDEEEMVASLGISEPTAGRPYCVPIRLSLFNLQQIGEALRKFPTDLQNEICSFAAVNRQFLELISRPSLLHIVSILWSRERLSQHLEKLTSAYVMRLFIRHSYLRQGQKESGSRDFMALTTEERQYFMKGIATYMAAKRLPNQIRGDHLNAAIAALVEAMPEAVTRRTSAMAGETRRPLLERMEDSEFGLEHVQTDVRTCGILVDDPAAPGTFRFGHKSFMEYLFAEVIADYLSDDNTPDAASILNSSNASATDIIHLPVSINFLEELLTEMRTEAADSTAEQKRLAVRILKLLLGDDTLNYAAGRLELYRMAATSASKEQSWPVRFLVQMCISHIFLLLPLLGVWTSGVVILLYFDLDGSSPLQYVSVGFGMLCAFAVMMVTYPNLIWNLILPESLKKHKGWRPTYDAIVVWNQICEHLNIEDPVLFEIAGIRWLPWTRNKSFDYFL